MWSEGNVEQGRMSEGEYGVWKIAHSEESQKEHVAGQDELPAPQKIFRYLGSHLLLFHETYCDH